MAGSSLDRRRSPLWWLVAVAVILGALASGATALATADQCGPYRAAKTWQWLPPHWECR
jgi:hypothetical protein